MLIITHGAVTNDVFYRRYNNNKSNVYILEISKNKPDKSACWRIKVHILVYKMRALRGFLGANDWGLLDSRNGK